MLLGVGVVYAVLEVSVEPNVVANPGQTVHLKCILQGIKEPLDMKTLMIQWYTRGKQIAEYDEKIQVERPEMSLSLEALKKGDATLTIQSFTAEHAGNYRCYVYYKSDHIMKQIVLSSNETVAQTESDLELSTCETVLDKKLDKVIDWISKVEGKLAEVTRSCSSKRDKTRGN